MQMIISVPVGDRENGNNTCAMFCGAASLADSE
jgi:hypothetical protein